jgi:Mn2+/Fe2+ NRAMP family transporter
MVMMMLMTSSESVMGKFVVTGMLRWVGWIATLAMGAAAAGMGIAAML